MLTENFMPPYSEEAEQSVLGAIILEPACIDLISGQIEDSDFYRQPHRHLYKLLYDMRERKQSIDVVTITNELTKKNLLDDVGGVKYLTDLASVVPTASNVEHYASIVREKATRRNIIQEASRMAQQAYKAENVELALTDAQERMKEIQDRSLSASKSSTDIKDLMLDAFDDIEKLSHHKGQITGTPMGFVDLDGKLNGLNNGDLIILAARPAMGKTAFALNVSVNVSTRAKKPVVIFSLEMGKQQISKRMLGSMANIDGQALRTGQLEDDDWGKLTDAIAVLADCEMKIEDSVYSLGQIRAEARRYHREYGKLGVIVIDYLQLITTEGNFANQNERVGHISRSLKLLAKELDCPIICLSQLSRQVEQRQDKRPMLSDLRDSGSIEQDADVVLMLYRDDYYNKDSEKKNIAEVIIGKQRSGPTGTCELLFLKNFGTFLSLEL